MSPTERTRNSSNFGFLVAFFTALTWCASLRGQGDVRSGFPANADTERDALLERIRQLEARAERLEALTTQHDVLRQEVQGLERELDAHSRMAVRLPPLVPEEGADSQAAINDELDRLLREPHTSLPQELPLPEPASEYGTYGNGLELEFWGWLSYLSTPQLDENTFWAWEAELDITKSFSEHIAASADIDFVDTNRGARVALEQLFLSVVLADEQETIFTAGKFNAPFGVEPRDFWDRVTGSTSLIFRAKPEDLTGIMLTHRVADTNFLLRPMVVNGFDYNLDVNKTPSLALMAEYLPCDDFSVAVTNWWGPEFPNDNADQLYFVDAQAVWTIIPEASLSAEFLRGTTESPAGRLAWTGYLVLATYDLSEHLRMFSMWSWLEDFDGFITGEEGEEVGEVSVGFSYFLHRNVEFRCEYRHDYNLDGEDHGAEFGYLDHWDAHFTFGY